ncbi:MAG: FAD-dependent oxidoreductase [Gammaproteobacteria bacterium]|nr:MAG: FAD-dependent oxidoreductase [Gammaproteobacteria bacterium]
MSTNIIVIGAGVVGVCSALALQESGHQVTLVDKVEPCNGASFGNAGAVINGSCLPTSAPGIIFDVINMIGQKHSPLSIRLSYFHKIFPWLLRFALQSRSSSFNQNAVHLNALSKNAVASWKLLTDKTPLSYLFNEAGWLRVYESEKTFSTTAMLSTLLDKMGTEYEILDSDGIRDLEPNLAHSYRYGFYQKNGLNITNPKKLIEAMVNLLIQRGGQYRRFEVNEIQLDNNKISLRGFDGCINADKVVIAAGAWSRHLSKQLGDDIPLDTERGYHLMLPESSIGLLNRPVMNGEHSFVLSPMEMGLRMTAQVEFAGLKLKPNYNRIRKLLPLAKQMLPKLESKEESVWMGFRPSLPDSLPVIDFSNRSKDVLYAFGHQHLGMTLGAVTGYLVSDMLGNNSSEIDVYPYRATRFNKW